MGTWMGWFAINRTWTRSLILRWQIAESIKLILTHSALLQNSLLARSQSTSRCTQTNTIQSATIIYKTHYWRDLNQHRDIHKPIQLISTHFRLRRNAIMRDKTHYFAQFLDLLIHCDDNSFRTRYVMMVGQICDWQCQFI